jgi:DNA (cytosine-5)-methyltransferase 1
VHRLNDSGVADERNDLIHIYFAFMRAFAPSVFLMENVPGMLWGRHAETLRRFYTKGTFTGYEVQKPVVIDARDFGVPQRRKRVFILGVKRGLNLNGLTWPPRRTHGSPPACAKDPKLLPWRNCAHVFMPARPDDLNDVHRRHSEELIEAFDAPGSTGEPT